MMNDMEEKLRIYRLLQENPKWCETIREALEAEQKGEKKYKEKGYGTYIGWEWHDVHTSTPYA
jgi:hypothetical protein